MPSLSTSRNGFVFQQGLRQGQTEHGLVNVQFKLTKLWIVWNSPNHHTHLILIQRKAQSIRSEAMR